MCLRETISTHLLFSIREKLSNILFTSANKFVQNFRTVDDLGLPRVEHLSDLSSHQGLSSSGRPIEQNTYSIISLASSVALIPLTLNVLDPQLLHQSWWENTRRERSSENSTKFSIKSTNPHILKLEVWRQNRVCSGLAC